jgi:hypothetical protein
MTPNERSGRDVPHLRAVPAPGGEPGAERSQQAPERFRGWVGVLLAAGLLLSLIGLALESRRATRLEGEVAALSASLAEARSALAAHRQRLAEARDRVSDLRSRVESLDVLLQSEPASAAARTGASATPPR